jgi:hypothetical protein
MMLTCYYITTNLAVFRRSGFETRAYTVSQNACFQGRSIQ